MLRRAVLCLVLSSAVVATPELALAKGAPSAKQADQEGQAAERKKKWAEAKGAYQKALELDDNPDTRMRLAGVEAKLGNLLEAAEQVKKVLEAKKLSFLQRAKAKNQLKALEKRTPTLTLDLPKGFDGKISLDGRELSVAELGAPVPVNPGKHQVRAEAEGMKTFSESVELGEKEKKNLSVLMTELPKDEPATPAPADKEEPKKGGGGNTLAWVALGVGVVGVGVGTYFGLQAKQTKNEIDSQCKNGVCSEAQRDLYDEGKTQANISTGGFIVGAVGVGVGTVLLLTGGKGKVEQKAGGRRAIPYLGPREVGVYGRF